MDVDFDLGDCHDVYDGDDVYDVYDEDDDDDDEYDDDYDVDVCSFAAIDLSQDLDCWDCIAGWKRTTVWHVYDYSMHQMRYVC